MPISKSNGAVAQTPVGETAPAPVNATLAKRVLETPKAEENRKEYKPYKERDFDAEARGKVACASFAAALASPGLAGLGDVTTYEKYIEYVRRAADDMVKYTWEHQK